MPNKQRQISTYKSFLFFFSSMHFLSYAKAMWRYCCKRFSIGSHFILVFCFFPVFMWERNNGWDFIHMFMFILEEWFFYRCYFPFLENHSLFLCSESLLISLIFMLQVYFSIIVPPVSLISHFTSHVKCSVFRRLWKTQCIGFRSKHHRQWMDSNFKPTFNGTSQIAVVVNNEHSGKHDCNWTEHCVHILHTLAHPYKHSESHSNWQLA